MYRNTRKLAEDIQFALSQYFFGKVIVNVDREAPWVNGRTGNYSIEVRWSPSVEACFACKMSVNDREFDMLNQTTFYGAPLWIVDNLKKSLDDYIDPRRLEDRIRKLETKKTNVTVEVTVDG